MINFGQEKKHTPMKCTPALQADVDKLKAMFDTADEHGIQANEALRCMVRYCKGDTYARILGEWVTIPAGGPFAGVIMCTSCIREAVMHLRDAAGALEDMVNEVEKKGVSTRASGDWGGK